MLPFGSHPACHPVFEAFAYAAAFAAYRRRRTRNGDHLRDPQRWNVIASAAVGALLGSRGLGLAEQWPTLLASARKGHLLSILLAPGGKTIVGGLLGGWLAVEIVKYLTGIRSRTGDLFAIPLCLGIVIGRIGCFLSGLADDTYGKPTQLPWAVDFGDGIPRHPVQLYEILFLAVLAGVIGYGTSWPQGSRFRVFMAEYLAWRLLIDFLKPQPHIAGMSLIQWTCAMALAVMAILLVRDHRHSLQKESADAAIA